MITTAVDARRWSASGDVMIHEANKHKHVEQNMKALFVRRAKLKRMVPQTNGGQFPITEPTTTTDGLNPPTNQPTNQPNK